jgi:hypothetical protein
MPVETPRHSPGLGAFSSHLSSQLTFRDQVLSWSARRSARSQKSMFSRA